VTCLILCGSSQRWRNFRVADLKRSCHRIESIESRMKYGPKLKKKTRVEKVVRSDRKAIRPAFVMVVKFHEFVEEHEHVCMCACVCVCVCVRRERAFHPVFTPESQTPQHPSNNKKESPTTKKESLTTHRQYLLIPPATCTPCQQSTWFRSQGYPKANVVYPWPRGVYSEQSWIFLAFSHIPRSKRRYADSLLCIAQLLYFSIYWTMILISSLCGPEQFGVVVTF
jgi:hypothetical protein